MSSELTRRAKSVEKVGRSFCEKVNEQSYVFVLQLYFSVII